MKLIFSIVALAAVCMACGSGDGGGTGGGSGGGSGGGNGGGSGGGGGGGGGGGTMSDDSDTEQVNGSCPSKPSTLVGHKGSGDSCSSSHDCSPSCCNCPGSSKQPDNKWLAAECKNGKCIGGSSACSVTASSSWCE